MTALRVHDENLSIEVEKHIERWVARFTHAAELSY